ncbi:hypothetical protein DEIPH_ctg040orf0077 [Deinococcus phoenicis]|uniref:PEGA domain-containing protein n=1 Tax=Deinococcus phoenicis TaxID=1476583 RepID=A0A016QMZ0_9DEIO|nr:PEGA domain-containing protein [Deinococcus phoenicis]EYB67500.1 hypothetical protein DEIPH_ctg040orf0077 [Deinococcus phoenicis]
MKPIGPYVAARDLTGDRPAGAVRTLRATDRLTGMPVLLHVLPHAAPLPDLPADPALLTPSEGGIDGETAYVVTELPPHALPASDPLLAARGALAGLAALHGAGLTHGGVNAAQLWSVDGRVALAGAGLPWGGDTTPAGDLHDLMSALDTLGGVPAPLRDAPAGATAHDLLALLNAPAAEPEPAAQDAGPPGPPEEARLQAQRDAPATPLPVSAPPSTPLVVTASVPEPLHGGPDGAAPDSSAPDSASAAGVPSPAEAQTDGDTAASAQVKEQEEPAPPPPVAPGTLAGQVSARRVVGEPVRIKWNADGTRQIVKPGREAAPAPARRPGWLWPVLALLLLVAGAWWLWRSASPAAVAVPPAATAAQSCCDVRFVVRGAEGVPVRLSLVSAPEGVKVDPGQEVGRAPGVVRLPRPGTYTLRVAAEGYTPGTVTLTAPTSVPVQIALTP